MCLILKPSRHSWNLIRWIGVYWALPHIFGTDFEIARRHVSDAEKYLLRRQKFDTYLESYSKMIYSEVIQDKKDFISVLKKHIHSHDEFTCSVLSFSL